MYNPFFKGDVSFFFFFFFPFFCLHFFLFVHAQNMGRGGKLVFSLSE